MKTLMIKDIPLVAKLSVGAARKIVGGILFDRGTPRGPYPVEPDGGIGSTPEEVIRWKLANKMPGGPAVYPPVYPIEIEPNGGIGN
jgi:hypothetical protein